MILVTGGTGFVGRTLIRQLVSMGYDVRTLLRTTQQSPKLPVGIPVDAVICSLTDERGLRSALKGVDTVFHLASAEAVGGQADLMGVDIEGTRVFVKSCQSADIQRFFYLSHLGADRYSAYPLFKAKAIAESVIQQSGIPYTIFRSGMIFGPGDRFVTDLTRLVRKSPGFLFVPEDGNALLQPLWIEDLVTCLTLALESTKFVNSTLSIGGGEYLTFREILLLIMEMIKVKRLMVPISPPYLKMLSLVYENIFRSSLLSIFWLDYLAANRTTELDTLPRLFGLMPARFNHQLSYLLK